MRAVRVGAGANVVMSPKRIPVSAAKDVARKHNCRQVIVLAWDGELTHIVTYGQSVEDCAQAATGGNLLKEKWGWPECNDQPSRVLRLKQLLDEATVLIRGTDAFNREPEASRVRAFLGRAEGASGDK
jgi:hypothetical protein